MSTGKLGICKFFLSLRIFCYEARSAYARGGQAVRPAFQSKNAFNLSGEIVELEAGLLHYVYFYRFRYRYLTKIKFICNMNY